MNRPDELPDLRASRPGDYGESAMLWSGEPLHTFTAQSPEDFDWLERMILENGFYERERIWGPEVNHDKRAIAEIVAAFAPARALEVGCNSGPVLQALEELDVYCEGVEISGLAIARAARGIRDRIHAGDLLGLDLVGRFDVVFGLDIFEHFNPNRLHDYLAKIAALLEDGGYLFAAIPAFSDDPVFGLVFPVYIREWYTEIGLGRHFRLIHVDDQGYPMNGHLIWADSLWWVTQFRQHGFHREEMIEHALHDKYDHFFGACLHPSGRRWRKALAPGGIHAPPAGREDAGAREPRRPPLRHPAPGGRPDVP
ncbi:MAG: class I SAM-dependent methyltransferase [Candidatus Rokuibacteriota bacterium]